MRRGEAAKCLRQHGKWVSHCERVVFMTLLDRADNTDCKIPAFLTPSVAKFAAEIGYSKSATAAALAHLERHGWLIRTRTVREGQKGPGRGDKTAYQLEHGCVCECPRHPKPKGTAKGGTEPSSASKREANGKHFASPDPSQPPSKGSSGQDSLAQKGSSGQDQKGSSFDPGFRRSDPILYVGLREGEGVEGGEGFEPRWNPRPIPQTSWPAGSIGEWQNR